MSSQKQMQGEVIVVLGGQWGDEGKGKLIDLIAENADMVCRCQGGNNAGHTVVAHNITYDFHLLPSGIIREKCISVIGNGVVIHLPGLFAEIEKNESKGLKNLQKRLKISNRAHIVLDVHQEMDGLCEAQKGKNSIGTTKKGIGPTYSDKMLRTGIRVIDLFSEENNLKEKVEAIFYQSSRRFPELKFDIDSEMVKLKDYASRIEPMVCDTSYLVNNKLAQGGRILVEGANAVMLDIDFGTYPYVTSSNCTIGGVCTGLGIPPQKIKDVYGAFKAYTTRIGSGEFPTELTGELGDKLQNIGKEFGVTTGRKRRCGWFDAVVAKYSNMINGYTGIALLKLDILDTFEEIKIGVSYKLDGKFLEGYPADQSSLKKVEVEYVNFPGWLCNTSKIRHYEDLPEKAKHYIKAIEDCSDLVIKWIGVGPSREAMIEK